MLAGGSSYLATVKDAIQIFEDVLNGDYGGVLAVVVSWIGSDAPCIVADFPVPRASEAIYVSYTKELIEAVAAVGEAIVQFFAEIGEGLYDVGKALYCAFADCSAASRRLKRPNR